MCTRTKRAHFSPRSAVDASQYTRTHVPKMQDNRTVRDRALVWTRLNFFFNQWENVGPALEYTATKDVIRNGPQMILKTSFIDV